MKASELDEFTRAYVECALWSTNDESTPQGGEPLDKNYSAENIDPATLDSMAEDCRKFQESNAKDLAKYNHPFLSADELGGHDFWLTRNGHGAGFWDRNWLPKDAGERLSEAARKCGEVDLYVGNDGLIHA